MKQIITSICVIGLVFHSFAQQVIPALDITKQKTTSLIFSSAITHVDRGSADILVQQVEHAENILLVKAAKKYFEQTSLSIVTADGEVYVFLINYNDTPACLIHHINTRIGNTENYDFDTLDKVLFTNKGLSQSIIQTYAKGILDNPRQCFNIYDANWGIRTAVAGLYIKDNILFIQILLHNQSSVNYDIDLIRFSIKDQKRSKRTASQEKNILPAYFTGKTNMVEAGKQNVIVFAMPKFSIPEQQYFSIEVLEQNGGRHLTMKLNNHKITRAKELPSFE